MSSCDRPVIRKRSSIQGIKMFTFSKAQLIVSSLWLGVVLLLGSGCGTTTQSPEPAVVSQDTNPESDINNVLVRYTDPEKSIGETEEFPLPNCGGTGELTQSLGTQASVRKGVTIGARASAVGGAEYSIPQATKLRLEIEVELAYQQDYEMANSRLDTIKMAAAQKTHVVYLIQWEEQTFQSIVTFEKDGQVFETPYTYVLLVPKIYDSFLVDCPSIGAVPPGSEANSDQSLTPQDDNAPAGENDSLDTPAIQSSADDNPEPIRDHFQVVVGNGIFAIGTFSDGQAPYSEQWLWDNDRFNIQRIRAEEYPTGCDVARYTTNFLWIGGTTGMSFSINGENVGTYEIADDSHGYIFNWPVQIGDTLCAVGFTSTGFQIILGPDVYYHYDSYCYRGGC